MTLRAAIQQAAVDRDSSIDSLRRHSPYRKDDHADAG
jgi:hypothetical protein